MFAKLKQWFQKNPKSDLEAYIISKNPQNAADVDHWVRYYQSWEERAWGRGI